MANAKFENTSFSKLARWQEAIKDHPITNLVNSTVPTEQFNLLPDTNKPITTLTNTKIIAKYGISKADLHWHLTHIFHMAPKYIEACSSYFLLHYTATKFKQRMQDGQIVVSDELITKTYNVVYDNCTPALVKNSKCGVMCSFRSAMPEIGIAYNYVIVRLDSEHKGKGTRNA